uniref:Uncharacterized protein n=1 Tax=Cannabis sativa TaxID=3483 RepID=A0A803RAL7_CANSA
MVWEWALESGLCWLQRAHHFRHPWHSLSTRSDQKVDYLISPSIRSEQIYRFSLPVMFGPCV